MKHRRLTHDEVELFKKLFEEGAALTRIAKALVSGRELVQRYKDKLFGEHARFGKLKEEKPNDTICHGSHMTARPPLPAGDPISWGAITSGTVLEGTRYPYPGAD